MFSPDLVITICMILQPSIIGLLLFMFTKYALANKFYFSSLKNARKRFKGSRFFECATHPRLLGKLKYDLQVFSFIIVFIVYDVDLLFFLSEAVYFDNWSFSHFFIFFIFFIFFVFGLLYDMTQQNFNWSY